MAKVAQGRINFLLEREHLKKESQNVYTLLENIDFQWHWSETEILEFDSLWEQGYSFEAISKRLNASYHEVWLMWLDRGLHDKIKPRKGGMNGTLG